MDIYVFGYSQSISIWVDSMSFTGILEILEDMYLKAFILDLRKMKVEADLHEPI